MSSENSNDIPTGEVQDNNYISRSGEKNQPIPVQSDSTPINDPIDEVKADTDEQLQHDDVDAIDESNIIDERTRGAKPAVSYREPGDEEGLPSDTGRSAGAA